MENKTKKISRSGTVWSTKSAPENATRLIHASRFITTKHGIPSDQIDTTRLTNTWSDLYKEGYYARKKNELSIQNKQSDIPLKQFNSNEIKEKPKRHNSVPKTSYNFVPKRSNPKSIRQSSVPRQPKIMFEKTVNFESELKLFGRRHDEQFNRFLVLMEKHNKLKEKSLGKSSNIFTKMQENKSDNKFLIFLRNLFSSKKDSKSTFKKERTNSLSDDENDSEFQNFVGLVKKHDENFDRFQKLLNTKDEADYQSEQIDNENFENLLKRRQRLTSIVRNEMISLNGEIEKPSDAN